MKTFSFVNSSFSTFDVLEDIHQQRVHHHVYRLVYSVDIHHHLIALIYMSMIHSWVKVYYFSTS